MFSWVRMDETQAARIKYAEAHKEILELTLQAAPNLKNDETVVLESIKLPFTVQLHKRHGAGSDVAVHCLIEGDGEALRLRRMRRALNDKCPNCQPGRARVARPCWCLRPTIFSFRMRPPLSTRLESRSLTIGTSRK